MEIKDRVKMLQRIFSLFQHAGQWIPWHISTAQESFNKAEGLIEYLEVVDCGSVGGFDLENPVKGRYHFKLYDRFIALMEKYQNRGDMKDECGFNTHTLGVLFKEMSALRQKVADHNREIDFKI